MRKIILALLMMVTLNTYSQKTDMAQKRTIVNFEIKDSWQFKQAGKTNWNPAIVPGTVHTDLLNAGIIKDPFYRTNEKDQQWIDKVNWEYKTNFTVSDEVFDMSHIELNFNGLDTYADVYLNDRKILSADNMFREWKVDCKKFIKKGENTLKVYLTSPILIGLQKQEEFGFGLPAINDQSEVGGLGNNAVSPFTRKAGYHYGWDWGPRFVTSGIWRAIYLNAWNDLKIENLFVKQDNVSEKKADLVCVLEISSSSQQKASLSFLINNKPVGVKEISLNPGVNSISINYELKKPKLWWSNGLGEPYLYAVNTKIKSGTRLLDETGTNIGIRKIEVVQDPDADGKGKSFYFRLNGRPIFAKGANYIPNDNFLTRVSPVDYEKVIKAASDANMNMLRVWGGGIYENEIFYDLCDKYGIMIWHDFMFACSMYPADEAFLNSLKNEFTDNIKRLRNHPCIALWCGNNEMDAGWSEYYEDGGWGWKQMYNKEERKIIWNNYEKIFHEMLPKVVKETTNNDFYWWSSPSAGFRKHAGYDTREGDMHYWGVWHGKHPFSDFKKYTARFMSEYGFQSFPDFNTVKKYSVESDWSITSAVMTSHQRSGIGNLRIKEYMEQHYRDPKDFKSFLYLSQVLQAEAIKTAIETYRQKMPYCMGSLYWQINDCWPVASWSSLDYYKHWKALHYFAKKAYNNVLVSSSIDNDKFSVFVVNDKDKINGANQQIKILDFDGKEQWNKTIKIDIPGNASKNLFEIPVNEILKGQNKRISLCYVKLTQKGNTLSDNILLFAEPKDIKLPKPDISRKIEKTDKGYSIQLQTNKLALNTYLFIEDEEGFFSDNYFTMLPGLVSNVNFSSDKEVKDFEKRLQIFTIADTY